MIWYFYVCTLQQMNKAAPSTTIFAVHLFASVSCSLQFSFDLHAQHPLPCLFLSPTLHYTQSHCVPSPTPKIMTHITPLQIPQLPQVTQYHAVSCPILSLPSLHQALTYPQIPPSLLANAVPKCLPTLKPYTKRRVQPSQGTKQHGVSKSHM